MMVTPNPGSTTRQSRKQSATRVVKSVCVVTASIGLLMFLLAYIQELVHDSSLRVDESGPTVMDAGECTLICSPRYVVVLQRGSLTGLDALPTGSVVRATGAVGKDRFPLAGRADADLHIRSYRHLDPGRRERGRASGGAIAALGTADPSVSGPRFHVSLRLSGLTSAEATQWLRENLVKMQVF